MIHSITISGVQVMYSQIPDSGTLSRRERERSAVADIVRRYGGDGAILRHDSDGAPRLEGCNVSVSHSRRLAVVAFDSSRTIGIDAEEWRSQIHNVKPRFMSELECSIFTSDRQLLAAWTIKEAVFKAAGDPTLQMSDISVSETMDTAIARGKTYDLTSQYIGDTLITLALLRE